MAERYSADWLQSFERRRGSNSPSPLTLFFIDGKTEQTLVRSRYENLKAKGFLRKTVDNNCGPKGDLYDLLVKHADGTPWEPLNVIPLV